MRTVERCQESEIGLRCRARTNSLEKHEARAKALHREFYITLWKPCKFGWMGSTLERRKLIGEESKKTKFI